MEKGEMVIVAAQFVALVVVVILLSSFTPSQSASSSPVIGSVYWGPASQGIILHSDHLNKVSQNESVITASFKVAFSTSVSSISGSRLCIAPNSTSGESTTYTYIPFNLASGTMVISPTAQQPGWVCTYTIKVTDGLLQTTTWFGSVELVK